MSENSRENTFQSILFEQMVPHQIQFQFVLSEF
jgi:hypothetical protein